MKEYALLFYPPAVVDEILLWAADLDTVIEVKCIKYEKLSIDYYAITFYNEQDELAFKLKYLIWNE